jgi:hypothetical protein
MLDQGKPLLRITPTLVTGGDRRRLRSPGRPDAVRLPPAGRR